MDTNRRDTLRQIVILGTALFQVFGAFVMALAGPPRFPVLLIQPADYAFAIWGLVFLLSLLYAVFQALPGHRSNQLLRQVGWLTAGAFFLNGLWEILVARINPLFSQFLFFSIVFSIVAAYVRLLMVMNQRFNSKAECWFVAVPVGIFAGWMTAAALVELFGVFIIFHVLSGSISETFLSVAILVLGGFLTVPVILIGKGGPAHGYLTYAGTILWALFAIVVKQATKSLPITGAAFVSILVVLVALLVTLVNTWPFGQKKRLFFSDTWH